MLAAETFRSAIEAADRSGLRCLERFPVGACSDASILLGEFLAREGLGEWSQVAGERSDDQSHAWLERGGLIIDITASQFSDVDEPVYVGPAGLWHQRFAETRRRPARIDVWDPATRAYLHEAFLRIAACVTKL